MRNCAQQCATYTQVSATIRNPPQLGPRECAKKIKFLRRARLRNCTQLYATVRHEYVTVRNCTPNFAQVSKILRTVAHGWRTVAYCCGSVAYSCAELRKVAMRRESAKKLNMFNFFGGLSAEIGERSSCANLRNTPQSYATVRKSQQLYASLSNCTQLKSNIVRHSCARICFVHIFFKYMWLLWSSN